MKKFAAMAAVLCATASIASAQMDMSHDKSKRPSPPASAECKFSDGKTVKIDYSSPRAKGRKIFGEEGEKALVPFGHIWRTGANEATTFVADANLVVGGKAVPAGNYTLFTVPRADSWTLVINKRTGEWGTEYDEAKDSKEDLVRVPMSVSRTSAPVENFTIAFDHAGSKCTLRMEWETTRASVEITK
ncbi:MAG: DUF2911 domain-containing protein [Terriglobales bacterium]|jgi:hypothetical protein